MYADETGLIISLALLTFFREVVVDGLDRAGVLADRLRPAPGPAKHTHAVSAARWSVRQRGVGSGESGSEERAEKRGRRAGQRLHSACRLSLQSGSDLRCGAVERRQVRQTGAPCMDHKTKAVHST